MLITVAHSSPWRKEARGRGLGRHRMPQALLAGPFEPDRDEQLIRTSEDRCTELQSPKPLQNQDKQRPWEQKFVTSPAHPKISLSPPLSYHLVLYYFLPMNSAQCSSKGQHQPPFCGWKGTQHPVFFRTASLEYSKKPQY